MSSLALEIPAVRKRTSFYSTHSFPENKPTPGMKGIIITVITINAQAEHSGIDRAIDDVADGALPSGAPRFPQLAFIFIYVPLLPSSHTLACKKEDKSSVPSSPNTRKTKGNRPSVGKRGGGKSKKISKSARAGLLFPKGRYARRISQSAAVYLSAVIEYLSAEMLELSGNACRDNKRQRLIPRHIVLAMKNDEELNQFCARVTCPGGGVLPFVHPALFAKGANSVPLRPVRRISTSLCEPGTT
ncbi:Histone H2A [Dirofilaria immitis]|nr:Histone H2A [Dirofilaria immitis]